jgi:GNAT superfamily N-acetyltransferase
LVRAATRDDEKLLSELLESLHGSPPWSCEREAEAREVLASIVDDPMRRLLIGFVGDDAAGTVDVLVSRNLTRDLHPFAVIENLVVTPAYRRMGVGTQLMEEALEFARGWDCYKIQLVSANRRDAAHRLYVSMGFHADVSGFRRYLKAVD